MYCVVWCCADGSAGCMLALNVTNRSSGTASHVVPMTAAEMATFRSIANVSSLIVGTAHAVRFGRCLHVLLVPIYQVVVLQLTDLPCSCDKVVACLLPNKAGRHCSYSMLRPEVSLIMTPVWPLLFNILMLNIT